MVMKVQSINPIYISQNYKGLFRKKVGSEQNVFSCEISSLTLPSGIAISAKNENEYFENFLNKKGKVTKAEYFEIIKKHPRTLVNAYKMVEEKNATSASVEQTAKAAVVLKRSYDEKYKGKYTIVSIGTSPSPITEVMSALGAKVVFLPASGLNTLHLDPMYVFREQYPTMASRNTNVKYIVDYACKNGINRRNNDFILLVDYCCSGTSLDKMCEIFEEEKLIQDGKMHDCSILTDLAVLTNFKNPNSIFRLEDFANIAHDMQTSNFESVSNVPHFHVDENYNKRDNHISSSNKRKRQLFREFEEFSQPLARAYSLCCINEAMKLI